MPQLKKWKILIYVSVFLLISFGGQFIYLVTDYFWYYQIQFTTLFTKTLITKLTLGGIFGLTSLIVLLVNLWIARKFSKIPFIAVGRGEPLSSPIPIPQLEELKPVLEKLMVAIMFVIAFFVGSWAASHWETALKFLHAVPFGTLDPLFDKDISFYVFKVPFFKFLFSFSLAIALLSVIVVFVINALNNRIIFSNTGIEIADETKVHMAVLGGLLCLLVAAHFQLELYKLPILQKDLFPGAGYSDIHATIPGLKALVVVAVIAAIMLLISPWYWNNKVLIGSLILLAGGTLLVRIYAQMIQKFQVGPNEIVKETPYIKHAIKFTREAYGLTNIQEMKFDPQENLTASDIRDNYATVNNIRLWEHKPLLTSYGQLQEIRTYYDFLDADNDRYIINGEYRQVMLSARELVSENVPSRNWINEHLTYTHGYGICLGPVYVWGL